MDPDFQQLFQIGAGCSLVLAPDLTIVAVTDGYLTETMTRRGDVLGRGIFDVLPDNPDDPGAVARASLRASLARVLAHGQTDTMALQKYDIRRPAAEGGGFEARYWSPVNVPVRDGKGNVSCVIHRIEGVTSRVPRERHGSEAGGAVAGRSLPLGDRSSRLLDTAPDAMVVVGDDGRIRLVNVQTERLFGYARSELLGQELALLIPDRHRRGHTDHIAGFFARPEARSMGSGVELFARRKDGTELPIEVSLSPLHTEEGMTVSAAIRDITERRRLEAAARLLADRLANAVESIQDAFALFDSDDRLVLCNSVYRRLVGESLTGSIIGKPYEHLLDAWVGDIEFQSEKERARFHEERQARRKHDQTTSFDVRMRDGRSLRVIGRRTAEGGIVKTVWDLTDDENRAEELRRARADAEAASTAKSEFLSSMSHELRTPLNAILGFAQLLERDRRDPLSERHRERARQILKGGGHLLRLIDDILDLARIEAGGVTISTEPVNVAELLDEVRTTLQPMATASGIDLEADVQGIDIPMVTADRTRFAQILMNFGSNAIKYNRAGGKIVFAVSVRDPGHVRVTVSDTGMGIPMEKQDKLFQPFQRAGQETGPIEGTGIGLVITRRLAELMGGGVGFRSVAGEGSEFWVDLPVHAAGTPSTAPPRVREELLVRLAVGERRLVLYVEDNPANVTFMRDLLSSLESIELLTAPTAEIGIELARERRPDVVIMDINLPGMSGLEALRALRAVPETRDVPVIALTAAASARDRQRGMQAGFHGYMTKPVDVDELLGVLEALLLASR